MQTPQIPPIPIGILASRMKMTLIQAMDPPNYKPHAVTSVNVPVSTLSVQKPCQ